MPTATAPSTKRLEARITTDLQALLKRAAEIQGRTVSDFVIDTMQKAAQDVIEKTEVIRLSVADQEAFASALINPPSPNDALRRAFARRKELLTPADE